MSIVNKVLTMFLGNKEERDLKEINPFVGKILNILNDKILLLQFKQIAAGILSNQKK